MKKSKGAPGGLRLPTVDKALTGGRRKLRRAHGAFLDKGFAPAGGRIRL